jgi:hypothetical protein
MAGALPLVFIGYFAVNYFPVSFCKSSQNPELSSRQRSSIVTAYLIQKPHHREAFAAMCGVASALPHISRSDATSKR